MSRAFAAVAATGLLWASGCRAVTPGEAPARGILDGTEQSFVVVGYSTSYAWPAMLQQMLDEHAGRPGVYHVLNAVIGGSPVEIWNGGQGSEGYGRTFGAMLEDFFGAGARLRGDAPEPHVALCQQSLQFTRTRRGPIPSADDEEGIRIGADALGKLATGLHEAGIQRVYFGMHIYKEPVEPEVGNERIALAALLERGFPYVFQGPDVWTPTRDAFPEAFDEDGIHPNEHGMKLMAEGWYRTLAGSDARQDIIDRMHARAYDVRAMMNAYRDWRKGPNGVRP